MRIEDRYAIVSGIRTRFWQVGTAGSTVILIHGIASSVEDWRPTIAALGAHHTVFALDLVGCGLSAKPDDYSHSLESLTGFVLAFMRTQEIGAAHLVGFSMGGHIALKCARSASDRVRSLSLLGPAGIGRETMAQLRLATLPGIGEVLTKPRPSGMRMLLRSAFHDGSKVTDAMVEERLRLARLPGAQASFLKTLRGFVGPGGFDPERVAELRSWLPSVAAPTLVVWGREDRFVPVAHARVLEQHLPRCRVVVYPQCGHLPQLEHPERLNGDVLAFLAEVDGHAAGPAALH